MSAEDPLKVSFQLPDEPTAQWLDLMIARSQLDPDDWLATLIQRNKQRVLAQSGEEIAQITDEVSQIVDNNPKRATAPIPDFDSNAPVRPRPAHARAVRPSSEWRTR